MKRKSLFALLMALVILAGALPTAASAADGAPALRSEAVVCLWEAAGSPAPSGTETPFTDVALSAPYAAAVRWAAETGLTDGTGGGCFSPDGHVSRAQMVAFLWKQAGKPASSAALPFSDVAADAWYAPALRWALENGLIDASGSFVPDAEVTLSDLQALLAAADAGELLAKLQGSYVELFPEMSLEKYVPVWSEVLLPYCSSAEELGQYYQMFTLRFMGTQYGADAIAAFADDPESAVFNCFFLHDIARFTIDGTTISGVDAGGTERFRHSYHYVQDLPVTYFGMELPAAMHVYESDDAQADAFRYFAFSDDTPGETYHLEFRYGASLENLANYTEGDYAYWLASAIPADYDDATMRDCISLFVTENLGEAAEDVDVFTAIAGESGTSYSNLFSVILDARYDAIWHDAIAAVTGVEQADACAQLLKGAISAKLYGPDAVAAYAESGGYAFDCWFINGAERFTFRPDLSATVMMTDGTQQTWQYEPLGTHLMGEGETFLFQGTEFSMATEGELYRSTEPAGEFSYLFFLPDTMETTYHLEFRYGSDPEALMGYMKGPYAYWLAAAIDADADLETITKVIRLFCLENLDYSQRSAASLSQIGELIGTWDADMSEFGAAYADATLYFTIDETGHGKTWINGVLTTEFDVYAYESAPGRGVYVAYELATGEAEGADYTLETDAQGRTVLTLMAADGTIRYVKRAG